MPQQSIDAYREGYNKARKDRLGGLLAEVTMGMLRDDPGGYYAAGYRDGAAGKDFSPPSSTLRKGDAELNPLDDKEAVKLRCPHCDETDWFEWRFLGKLKDPVCGHEWYVSTGLYAGKQIRAAFQLGGKVVKYMNHGVAGDGAWLVRGMSYFAFFPLGVVFRLPFGLLMIPIQAVAAHNSRKRDTGKEGNKSAAAGAG